MNEAMKIERAEYLQSVPYERTQERGSHANGFKPKTINSRLGKLQLQVPLTRDPNSIRRLSNAVSEVKEP